MTRRSKRYIGALAAALVTAALAPATSAGYTDFRSPDTSDAGRTAEARDYRDLRSPDAGDAGVAASDRTPSPASTGESSGTDWHAAAPIAAGGLLVLSALVGVVLLRRRSGGVRTVRVARPGRVS